MNKIILFMIVICIIYPVLDGVCETYFLTQITDDDQSDAFPLINDENQICWHKGGVFGGPEDNEIIFFDGLSELPITDNDLSEKIWDMNNNGQIVFTQSELDGSNPQIMFFDDHNIYQIPTNTNSPSSVGLNESGEIIWADENKIFHWDGVTVSQIDNLSTQYPNAYIESANPVINNNGIIVFRSRISYGFMDAYAIFQYNGQYIDQLTDLYQWPNFVRNPYINDNGEVVWTRTDDDFTGICYYNGMEIKEIAQTPTGLTEAIINNKGDIVWVASDGEDNEVFLHAGGETIQVTNNNYHDGGNLNLNENGYIVWWARDNSDAEIFVYNGIEVSKITDNEYDATYPRINNNNYIVFHEVTYTSYSSEIFLAKPGSQILEIEIDIKPGSDSNCFNNDDNGIIPIAIFGDCTNGFDVNQIDSETIEMAGLVVRAVGKSDEAFSRIDDLNDDSCDDLIVQIEDSDGAFEPGNGIAMLTGTLIDGTPFEGSDSICVVPVND